MSIKALVFDIETSDLRPDWGTTLCIGYKWIGDKKPTVLSIMDYDGWQENVTDDKRLIETFHKVMMESQMYISFYGKDFDLKWLNSKFLEYGLPILPSTAHVDLYYTAKGNLNLSRKSLDNLSKFLGLKKKKYYVEGAIWKLARVGKPDAIKKLIDHCAADVEITEEAYYKLRGFVRQHPRINGYWTCRVCGSNRLQSRGKELTTTKGTMIRFKCTDCGSWSRYPEKDAEVINKE